MDPSSNKMSNLTIRVWSSDRKRWRDKAAAAGMTLNRYITHVLNGTEIKSVVMAADQHPPNTTTQPREDVASAHTAIDAQHEPSPIC